MWLTSSCTFSDNPVGSPKFIPPGSTKPVNLYYSCLPRSIPHTSSSNKSSSVIIITHLKLIFLYLYISILSISNLSASNAQRKKRENIVS